MRTLLIKLVDKIGLNSSFLKTNTELTGQFLEKGNSETIPFPDHLDETENWSVKKWNYTVGQIIKPGDIVCRLQSKSGLTDFESNIGGKLNYSYPIGVKLTKGSRVAVIIATDE